MNTMPLFWARPEKLMPETVMQDSTASFSFSLKYTSILLVISRVCSMVAPLGMMTWARSMP